MFVRKKKNKGGSTSIMLVTGERISGKKHSVSRIVKNFGVAKDEEELAKLYNEAKNYKAHLEAINPKAKILKISSERDIKRCHSYNVGFNDVYGNAFDRFFNKLNLKPYLIQRLKDLVIMRIAEPTSKRKTAKIGSNYNKNHTVDDFYKLMDQLTENVIGEIKKNIYQHTKEMLAKHRRKIDVLFYDLTTVYFETCKQDELRDFGFSKDGKHQHVQVMLAIIVTKEGLPIDYEEFKGNSFEGHTLIPVINKIRERYNIDQATIVADAALMNRINLNELNSLGIKYIIAARIKNSKKEIKEQILQTNDYKVLHSDINDDGGLGDQVKAKIINVDNHDSLIAFHSLKRSRKDANDRLAFLEKINKHLGSNVKNKLKGSLKKPYVKISKDCTIEIDYLKLQNEEQYDGFFGIQTNIGSPDPLEILNAYRGLWQVEQTFRVAKSTLEIRPVFHYVERRVKAHFAICYMALALIRYVEFMLKYAEISQITMEELHLLLKQMRKIEIINSSGESFELLEDPPPELPPVYRVLGIRWPKRFQYK